MGPSCTSDHGTLMQRRLWEAKTAQRASVGNPEARHWWPVVDAQICTVCMLLHILVQCWWFGTWLDYDFPIILGMSSSQLTHIFQRGRSTTNQWCFVKMVPGDHGWEVPIAKAQGLRCQPSLYSSDLALLREGQCGPGCLGFGVEMSERNPMASNDFSYDFSYWNGHL